jgi:hypothetical protein
LEILFPSEIIIPNLSLVSGQSSNKKLSGTSSKPHLLQTVAPFLLDKSSDLYKEKQKTLRRYVE